MSPFEQHTVVYLGNLTQVLSTFDGHLGFLRLVCVFLNGHNGANFSYTHISPKLSSFKQLYFFI